MLEPRLVERTTDVSTLFLCPQVMGRIASIAVDTYNCQQPCHSFLLYFQRIHIMPKGKWFNLILIVMNKNGKNEELQSRREFFKKAAKGALPILGAIVLANTPVIANAAEESPMGCNNTCYRGCASRCTGRCQTTCNVSCQNHCHDKCGATCKYTCSGKCTNNNKY